MIYLRRVGWRLVDGSLEAERGARVIPHPFAPALEKAKLSLFYSIRHDHKNFEGAQVRDSWVRPILLLCQT